MTIGGTGAGYESGEITGLPLFSIGIAWVYNSTRGEVLFAMLFHAMINTTPILGVADVTAVMELSELAVLLGLPIDIILYYGWMYLAATRPEPPVPEKTLSQRDS